MMIEACIELNIVMQEILSFIRLPGCQDLIFAGCGFDGQERKNQEARVYNVKKQVVFKFNICFCNLLILALNFHYRYSF
jgi:hypothetical protein